MPDLEQEVARGHEAERIMRSPVWEDSWKVFDDRLVSAWSQSKPEDADNRERIWVALQISRKIRKHIESIMKTGHMAQKQVEELNERAKR